MSDGVGTADAPWTVGVLADKLKAWIDRLGQVWVEGEITQWSVSGGSVYGKLKDLETDVTVSFRVWSSTRARLPDDLKQGDRVIALIKPEYWLKAGSLTMQVFAMRHVGIGDLLEKLERLRAKLAAEGLFRADRKRRLPFLPHCIGLITGKDSDAEKDVLRNAQLRWPDVRFRTVHAAVQGDRTVPEVLAALQQLDADAEVDVIIVARGGGDFQNLLGFSDERIVRAVAAAGTPVVSAIGHEVDTPLLDLVADVRASTPTDAAKRVVPDVAEELARVAQARAMLRRTLVGRLEREERLLADLRSRPSLADPFRVLTGHAEQVQALRSRAHAAVTARLHRADDDVAHLRERVAALSPAATLARGYAVVQDAAGHVVREPEQVGAGDRLRVRVAGGELAATVAEREQA
jgi:exodeoxyribonuclease VII large subunit